MIKNVKKQSRDWNDGLKEWEFCKCFFKFVSFIYAPYLLVMVPLLTSRSKARTVDGVCGYVLNPTFNNRGRFVFLGEWQVSHMFKAGFF